VASPVELDGLAPGAGPWEVELGFGKGRYLIQRARAEPEVRFLGIEVAAKYHRLLAARAERRGVENLIAVRAEALQTLATVLPRRFARAVHVYFPDPWPKVRHRRRRLFDPETVDLVLGLLRDDGCLFFATDFLEYGALVETILRSHPNLVVERLEAPWEDGARTSYEAKYEAEGRPIHRLVARVVTSQPPRLHPDGRVGVVVAYRRGEEAGQGDGS